MMVFFFFLVLFRSSTLKSKREILTLKNLNNLNSKKDD